MTSPDPGAPGGPVRVTGRSIAVTIDDLPVMSVSRWDLETHRDTTARLLQGLETHGIPAVGFVNESRLGSRGEIEPERIALLERWLDARQELANHTYSHLDLHLVPAEEFERDIVRGDQVTRALLAARGRIPRWFRHPYLHTGRDLATRDRIDRFVQGLGFRVAPVTLYNEDYWFAAAYDWSLHLGKPSRAARVARDYLAYLEADFEYHEALSRRLFGREIPQILLMHANALNAHTLDALAGLIRGRGYTFATLEQVLEDPAYGSPDEYTGDSGRSWLKRWALTRGHDEAFLRGEPCAPPYVRWHARTPLRVVVRRWAGRTRETLYERIKRPWKRAVARLRPARPPAARRDSSTH